MVLSSTRSPHSKRTPNEKALYALIAIALLVLLAGKYKFNYLAFQPGYTVDGNPIPAHRPDDLCDEYGHRYRTAAEAEAAGLKPAQYGVTYCPEYKMDPSWDHNHDGINDCYGSNSCGPDQDCMSPRR